MTGDIRVQLASSEAADSLRMERFIAQAFQERRWPAAQGVYYNDPGTGKLREIDVISRHVLQRPRRHRGIGAPIINLDIICECKSLHGSNILLSEGEVDISVTNRMIGDWSGYDIHIRELVEFIAQDPAFPNCDKNDLYSYFRDRAYPDDLELSYYQKIPPPQIELTATAFRETKSGRDDKDRSDRVNPLWSAIQSALAVIRASEMRTLEVMRAWTMERSSYGYEQDEFIANLAFIFDAELARRVCYHPVIFCKARLFRLTDNGVEDVDSARIYIRDLSLNYRYVDVVRFEATVSYLDQSLSHFEKWSAKGIRKTWDRLEALEWAPGQASDQLSVALGISQIPK